MLKPINSSLHSESKKVERTKNQQERHLKNRHTDFTL